mgnify:FL=1
MPAFFGLTSNYRQLLYTEIHDLVFHGGGGFIHSEVYNMPIWLRRYHIDRINEFNKKQQEEIEKAQGRSNIGDGEISRPNINPSQFYFNK